MSENIEELIEELDEVVEYSIESEAIKSCTILRVKKKGNYFTAYARCSDGRIVTGTSSNINVAKGLACNECG